MQVEATHEQKGYSDTVCEILYEVKAKPIIEALLERQAKVENKTS